MADAYAVFVEGLEAIRNVEELKREVELAAVRAINSTADRSRTQADREIRQQVAFPATYLSPSSGRLTVTQRARRGDLEARIRGRHRPTSLARFATKAGKAVNVEVKPGLSTYLPRAFLIRLRAGSGITETKFNQGLAIRLKPGETLRNKKQAIRMASGLYLLYGPSVDQVFRDVAVDISPETARRLEEEFLRLVDADF
jgi:hypothetical protein